MTPCALLPLFHSCESTLHKSTVVLTYHPRQSDLQELQYSESGSDDEQSEDEDMDPIAAERKRRVKKQNHLRRTAGEPQKPPVAELLKLRESFLAMLRMVLAE